ncbi:unnamed protein product [Prorocentrum cordatum]|uniref:Beta-lactamase-related domain-containing protein n=1 Tax=Prorocentrum cordatum TaxID=2364126 RepID=A0ABN9QKJ7_9DINO|nr:unnamed protein product [Polarella glacialis]
MEEAGPERVGVDPAPFRGYEEAMALVVKRSLISGCASVAMRKGKVFHSGCWGSADLETGAKFGFDTLCRMVCATKSYVAVAFMALVEEGLASPDDRLDTYIPAFAGVQVRVEGSDRLVAPKRPILLKHLMSHTSGIGYSGDVSDRLEDLDPDTASYQRALNAVISGKTRSLAAFVSQLAKVPLSFHPGYKYQYSFAFDVLGRVVEIVSGKRLDRCLQDYVFGPLGMKSTMWAAPDSQLDRLAAYYANSSTCKSLYGGLKGRKSRGKLCRIDGRSARESHWRKGRQAKVLSGGGYLGYVYGGMLSTVRDTVAFVKMLYNYGKLENGCRLLKKSTVMAMEKNRLSAKTSGDDRVCYLGNIGTYREGSSEYGMGGAACTYWNIDRADETAAVWFTQNCDMPEFDEFTDPKKADMWAVMHQAPSRSSCQSAAAATAALPPRESGNMHGSKGNGAWDGMGEAGARRR